MSDKRIVYAEDAIKAVHNLYAIFGSEGEWVDRKDVFEAIDSLPSAQPECIQNNAVHLCDSCQYTYVTCPSHGNDAVFGDGKGNDNICACNKYRPISAQPEDIARDIATIIENEKDMRVVLKNTEPQWIPVTKEEMFKAGYEGREIRFRVDGRLFAIRELAQ